MSFGGGGQRPTTSTTTVQNQFDPEVQGINRLLREQLTQGIQQTGGIPRFLQFNPLAIPGAEEMDVLRSIGGRSTLPLLSPIEQAGIGQLEQLIDPTAALGLARQRFEGVVSPQIINTLTASGLGRSGAIGESLARGGLDLILPILQQSGEAQRTLASTLLGLGPSLESRELSRLQTTLNALAAPRQALFGEFARPFETLIQLLGRTPSAQPIGSTQNQVTQTPIDWFGRVAGGASGFGGLLEGIGSFGRMIKGG